MKSLIKKLAEIAGPSGYESQVRALIREEIAPYTDEVWVDNLGNLIARKGRLGEHGLKILVDAHMDEIGLIVTHIDSKGFARFSPIGSYRSESLAAARVQFVNGARGVIGTERLSNPSELPEFQNLFIDLGIADRDECPVQVGDMAVYDRPFLDLGQRIVSKALDNRAGVALLIEVIRQIEKFEPIAPNEFYFVFSAQEEIGARGSTVAAFGIEPDLGLVVDLTASGGTPKGLKMEVELGKGPAIKVRDQLMLSNPKIIDWMVSTAKSSDIPYQLEILEMGSTNGRAIQLSRSGVPVGGLSIPARYIHSSSEMIDFEDYQNSIRLLQALLCNPINFEK